MALSEDTDILNTLNPRENPDEVLERLQRMALQAVDHTVWREWRNLASKDHLYWEGTQWDAEELAELAARKQPATVFNEIKPIVERVIGQVSELYQTVRFIGRNAPDEAESDALSEILRWIDEQNDQEFEEGDATLDMLVSGFAVEEINVEEDADGQPMIIERYVDALNHMYPDPYSRNYDWNVDARFVCRAPWMDLEDAIARWPEKRAELEAVIDRNDIIDFAGQALAVMNDALTQFVARDRRRVRPCEVWYKRRTKRYQLLDAEGKVLNLGVPLDRKDAQAIIAHVTEADLTLDVKFINEMWVGIFAGNVLIHHDRSNHEHNLFPFVPLWAWRKKNGGPYGIVRNLISPSEAINKRESKALHLISSNQLLYEDGTIDNPVETATALAQPDGLIRVTDGAISGRRIQLRDQTDMGQAQLAMHQNAVGAIQRIATATDRDRGLSPEIRSGVGVQRQQHGGNLALSPLLKNIRRSRKLKAQLKLEYIKQYFTEDMVFQITDDPNKAKVVNVSSGTLDRIRSKKFNVVIVDDTDHHTTRAEEQSKLFSMLPQLIPLGPAWTKLGIQLSNLREKQGLLDMVDQINQLPPPAPKMSLNFDYGSLDPEERAAFWMQMQNPELAQHILQNRPDSELLKKLKADIAQTQIKEGTKAMMERGKRDETAKAVAMEGIRRAKELDQEALIAAAEQEVAQAQANQPGTSGA